tara:strand:- start:528 stop:731 length:204 start_codon:yes stop_codon:yes gene_type:complete
MSPASRRYRVCLIAWDTYETFVDAADELEAVAMADQLYTAQGLGAFVHQSGGTDGYTAERDDGPPGP